MMVLGTVFSPALIKVNLESVDKDELFEELVDLYVSRNPTVPRDALLEALRDRESKLTTGVKPGVALPHARTELVPSVSGIIGVSRSGIDYDALDGKPVHLVFMLFTSDAGCNLHLRVLKRLALLVDDPEFTRAMIEQKDPESIYTALCRFEETLTTSM
jgi:PTS system fructose-specific IIC component/PTS system nitrogen regulatory IIA component